MAWVLIEPLEGGYQRRVFKKAFLRWPRIHNKVALQGDQRSNGRKVYRIVQEAAQESDLPVPTTAAPASVRELPVPLMPKEVVRDVAVARSPQLPPPNDEIGPDGLPQTVAAEEAPAKKMGRPRKVTA